MLSSFVVLLHMMVNELKHLIQFCLLHYIILYLIWIIDEQ